MMNPRAGWAVLFSAVLLSRMAHLRVLWVEECYPAAAAIQILHGKLPYRDFFFDKPPLAAFYYLLWGGYDGWPLRLAGTLYVLLCCWLVHQLALSLWSPREAWLSAGLVGFFLIFDTPSGVLAMAPDLLLLAPHVAAVWMAWAGFPWIAGVICAVALMVHTKAVFIIALCLWLGRRRLQDFLMGFMLTCAAAVALLAAFGMLEGYLQQVWAWGFRYAADSFLENPAASGLRRTGAWGGFHAALVIGAPLFFRHDKRDRGWFAAWILLSLAGVAAGWRFSPRYYFLLLPVMVLAASRGIALTRRKPAIAICALLLIPLIRFGPRYVSLAFGRSEDWADIAMNRDSRRAADEILQRAASGDTLLVWGYRPDIFVYTRMAAGAPFLDSQPLTGVIADRHLTSALPSAPDIAAGNRARLDKENPTFIVDGLGPYNPALAIDSYSELAGWLRRYSQVASTSGTRIYRAIDPASTPRASPRTR